MKNKIIILLVICSLFSDSWATTYYVNNTCTNAITTYDPTTDSCTGGSDTVYSTGQSCANITNPGDSCVFASKTYTDYTIPDGVGSSVMLNITRSGTSSNPIIFKAKEKWGAVYDGGETGTYNGIRWGIRIAADYITIDGFEIKKVAWFGVGSNSSAHDVIVKNNDIHNVSDFCNTTTYLSGNLNGMGIANAWASVSPEYYNWLVENNLVHDIGKPQGCANNIGGTQWYADEYGLYLNAGHNIVAQNNVFWNNKSGWNIHVARQCDYVAGHTTHDGVSCPGDGVGVKLLNNTFADSDDKVTGDIVFYRRSTGGPSPGWYCTSADQFSEVLIQNNIGGSPVGAFVNANSTITNSSFFTLRSNIVQNSVVEHTGSGTWDSAGYANSINPLFTSPGSPNYDYSLQAGSPVITLGTYANAPIYDIDGKLREDPPGLGAYKYGTADISPPTVPGTVTVTHADDANITIAWAESSDNVGVAGYKIYRDTYTTPLYTGVTASPYNDSGLTAATQYCYKVSAYDTAGNESALSAEYCDTTDSLGAPLNYAVIFGASTTKTDCSDFGGANSVTVGDYQTHRLMYDFTSLYWCVDSVDTSIVANCTRDGACYADDATKIWLSPANNEGDGADLTLIISMNGSKQDSTVAMGLAKDIAMQARVTTAVGHTYIWTKIPWSSIYTSIPRSDGTIYGFQPCEINGTTQNYVEKCGTKGTMTFGIPPVKFIRVRQ